MSIQFNHTAVFALQNQKPILKQLKKVVVSGIFLEGSQNKELTHRLQLFFKVPYVVPVASGHDALVLSLQALHLNSNDEIIIPANSYPTAFAAYQGKAKVVLADVNQKGQLSLKELQKKVTAQTRVVIVVHLYGLAGDIEVTARWLKKHDIILIEDCAQAFGTTIRRRSVGTFGRFGCFSFYPTKNLGALGDGGAIITSNKKDFEYLLQAKAYGESQKYNSQFLATHSRLPEVQASILNLYLQNFKKLQQQREKVAQYFYQQLVKNYLDLFVQPLKAESNVQPTLHLFVIRAQQRDQLQKFLSKNKIETHIHYPKPIHHVRAFQSYFSPQMKFPQSEQLSASILSLPFHQFLTKKQIDLIVGLIKKFYFNQLPKLGSVTFLFPAYNDAKALPGLIKKVDRIGPLISQNYQIIVVNDGSRDQTKATLISLQKKYTHLAVIHHLTNQGYGGALRTGFQAAHTEWLFYTDGDGQYDPNEITLLLQKLKLYPRSDVVNGYKHNRQDNWVRTLGGKFYNTTIHFLYPLPIRDLDCDFRLIKLTKLKKVHLKSNSGVICLELVSQLFRNKARFQEVEVSHLPRLYGHSQFFQLKHLRRTFTDHLKYFFSFYLKPQNNPA